MLHIQQAREADKPVTEAIYGRRVCYNDAHDICQWDPDEVSWEAFSKLCSIADHYVGTVNEKVVCGLFIVDKDVLYWLDMEKGTSLYLHKICVDPAYSGNGYADAVVQYFIEEGRREGYPDMRLDVRGHKDKLQRMYEQNGSRLYKTGRFHPDFTTALYIYPFEKTIQLSMPVSQQLA